MYATLIIVVAVVPVFFLEGLSGAFFRPLALSYALAVLASLVVALTRHAGAVPDPALSARRSGSRDSPLVRVFKRGYGAILAR